MKENINAGTDTVKSSVNWTLGANVENLTLTGSALNGVGNSFKNSITGNAADNTLAGNGSDDSLDGKSGVDKLDGGSGNDLLKITSFNGDIINGGTGAKDVLQLFGANQHIDLTTTTTITGIESIKFSGSGNNILTLTAQSVLDLSTDSDTLNLDAGWKDGGIAGNYQVYTSAGATVKINTAIVDVNIPETPSYTISDAATAGDVSSFFTDGADEIVIDLGAIRYNESDLSGGTIDLSGFGLEDTLVIAVHDGIVTDSRVSSFSSLSSYFQGGTVTTVNGSQVSVSDQMRLNKSAGTVKLISQGNGLPGIGGSIQIIGVPGDLPSSQLIFI